MNSAERRETWERCWAESPGMVPTYFSPGEYEKLARLRSELYKKYLGGVQEVSEFGCGLGHNLTPLLGTARRLRGFDWADSAVRTVRAFGIDAQVFDMFEPDMSVELHGGAVLTVHALEQLGKNWKPFLGFLLAKNFDIAIHIEPIEELYGDSKRDRQRLAYHRKRGYLCGFLPELEKMERFGMAELIEVRKSEFGGKTHDAYSVIVWRPT